MAFFNRQGNRPVPSGLACLALGLYLDIQRNYPPDAEGGLAAFERRAIALGRARRYIFGDVPFHSNQIDKMANMDVIEIGQHLDKQFGAGL